MNRLVLQASMAQVAALRYTPAGIPVLDFMLEHESTTEEMGQARKITLALKAMAFGAQAETLAKQALGSEMEWQGFMTNTRNGKGVVFHIQAFKHT
ncbi:MAG TPA: primosomal replication protein N [Macromonas sp.]|nr:primosomal replication protein N [Macromonas sp.]